MEVYLLNKEGENNITNTITNLTISGEYRSCCRCLSFGFIKSPTDKNTFTVGIYLGDNVRVVHEGKELFFGVVWSKGKSTDTNEIDITCKDYGIYLNKNSGTYSFKGMIPENIVKKVCSDFNIPTGNIATTGKSVSRKFSNAKLYDIIMTCYSLANDKKYMIMFNGKNLNVIEKGIEQSKPLENGINLLKTQISESLDSMVNSVNVYGDKDKIIYSQKDENNIKLYGLLNASFKYSKGEDYKNTASKKLQGIERKVTVQNFGDVNYITGKAVVVAEEYTGLKGLFYIDADEHNFKNGIYTNKLTLNFENMMDEKESGSGLK